MPFDEQQCEEQLKFAVRESLQILYDKDCNLILRGTGNVNERSIVFRFGNYFQKITEAHQWFLKYDIDVEYNRNQDSSKRTYLWKNGTYPDFIVHKRKQNSTNEEPYNNLLILEFKTHYNKSILRKGNLKKEIKGDKEILSDWIIPRVLKNGCDRKAAVVDYLKIQDFIQKDVPKEYQYLYRFGASIILEEDTPVWCWMDGDDFRQMDRNAIECPVYEPVW